MEDSIEDRREAFVEAATRGDIGTLRQMIQDGINVNVGSFAGWTTALMAAAKNGHEESVRLLLASGADARCVFDYDGYRATVLDYAATHNHVGVMAILCDETQALTLPQEGERALQFAAATGAMETAHFLIEHGVPVNSNDPDYGTPLMSAVIRVQPEMVTFLLEHGADTEIRNRNGETVLEHAIRNGLVKITRILRQAGAQEPSSRCA